MPIFVYVLLGIALLIALLLITKVRVFICYDDSLRAYARLWFFKFNIFPEKVKRTKKEKKKKRQTAEAVVTVKPKKEKSIPKKLWEMKSLLSSIISKFLDKIHFRFLKLKINIACDNAAKTALLYAAANQGVAYIIEILRNISNVDVSENSEIYVNSDFISRQSDFEGKIELYIRVLPLLTVSFHSLKEYEKYKSTKED